MKRIKKITSWMLIAVMAAGAFLPAQSVEAKQLASYPEIEMTSYGDSETGGAGASEAPAVTEEPVTKAPAVTEEPVTEAPAVTEEPVTEAPAVTEEPTTEAPAVEQPPTANPNLVVSKLSPATARVIVIDPGHCAKHPGASGNGLREEVVVLDISQACQNALDAYGDVTVYMTREDGGCPSANGLGDDLLSRNNYAKLLDADFLVSMHINAGRSSGANVLAAYKSGYNDRIRQETQAFGKLALSKLKNIGIANRGLLLRKSEAGNRYSNGKLADYYSIVRNGVLQNIPSVIIEHGYITSASDCNNFFKTKAKRQKVGKADADAIISYYGLSQKVIGGTFSKEGDATYYVTSNNKKAAGWIKSDGKWYYFDEANGKMRSGFVTVGEDTFYLSPSTGEMVVGWFTVDGSRYLARGNGTLVKNQTHSDGRYTYLFDAAGKQLKKGFHTLAGFTYYVNSKKYVVKGSQKINGKYYLFDTSTCQMLYGYQKVNGKYYYLDPKTGVMARKKIVEIDGDKYYFSSSGVRLTGWVTYKKNKYYFSKSSGKMLTGWRKINKNYYYFSKTDGTMQKSKWIGKYYVNYKGIRSKKK